LTFVRCLSLAVASAVTAEFLLGDQYLNGFTPPATQLIELLIYVLFYGCAAVIIREIARRLGRGWPTIVLLALGFGVIEEGVLTQSLFNPGYAHAHLLVFGHLPFLGTAGPWLVFVLTLHVIWSIGSPTAIIERAYGEKPWLCAWALIIPAVLFLVGAFAIRSFSASNFGESGLQFLAALVAAVALIVVALLVPRRVADSSARHRTGIALSLKRPLGAAAVGLILSAAFQAAYRYLTAAPWLTVVAMLVVLAAGVVLALTTHPNAFGLASGAVTTYCIVGLMSASRSGTAAVIEQVILVVIALAVLVVIAARVQSPEPEGFAHDTSNVGG
jgi:hypothetical protein